MRRYSPVLWPLLLLLLTSCSLDLGVLLPQDIFQRRVGRILYIGAGGNLHTIDQSGEDRIDLTTDAEVDTQEGNLRYYDHPSWSPVGRRLAYSVVSVPEGGQATTQIYIREEGESTPRMVFESSDELPIYLYWSPRGNWLSFLTSPLREGTLRMYIAPAVEGEAQLFDQGQPYYWAWSPQEDSLIAHVGGSAQVNPTSAKIARLPFEGGQGEEIKFPYLPSRFQAPEVSPDGSKILFAQEIEGEGSELSLADREGEGVVPLASFEGAVAFDWAPAGEVVAFLNFPRPGQAPLGQLSFVDLREPENLRTVQVEGDQVNSFFWAPDGSQVAYFVPGVDDAGEGIEVALGVQQQERRLVLELHLADARTGRSSYVTTFQPTQAFLNILPFFDQYQRSATLWSPDSKQLVLPTVTEGVGERIMVVSATGDSQPRFLAMGKLAFWSGE